MRTLSIAGLQIAPVAGDPDATLERFAEQAAAVKRAVEHVQLLVAPRAPPLGAARRCSRRGAGTRTGSRSRSPGRSPSGSSRSPPSSASGWSPARSTSAAPTARSTTPRSPISPERGLVAAYRKAFPWQPSERTEPGNRFVVFEIDGVGRAGLAICYDGFFPEVFRQLAWMGAEVVFQPTLTTTSDRGAELVTARANAIVNQLYVVNVNAAAPAGLGRSLIVDPEGMVKVEAGGGEELLTDVLDLDAVTRVREFGTAGVSRMWRQIDSGAAAGVELPMYEGGRIQPRP